MDIRNLANSYVAEGKIFDSQNFCVGKGKKVEILRASSKRFRRIVIVSDVNVNIASQNSCSTNLCIYGKSHVNGSLQLKMAERVDRNGLSSLIISVILQKGESHCSVTDLTMDVFVPHMVFDNISVYTEYSDIYVDGTVISVNALNLHTESGYIECNASFCTLLAASTSGDCDLFINARKNISAIFKTVSGDFLAVLNNVGNLELIKPNTTGHISNHHRSRTGHSAIIQVKSISGDIKIH